MENFKCRTVCIRLSWCERAGHASNETSGWDSTLTVTRGQQNLSASGGLEKVEAVRVLFEKLIFRVRSAQKINPPGVFPNSL